MIQKQNTSDISRRSKKMNLVLKLAEIGRLYPEHEAMVYNEKRFSYSQLIAQVNQFANGLKKFGVQQGDRVLIALGNCPEFVISFFAILQIKGVVIPVNPQYAIAEVEKIAKDALPVAVITDTSTAPTFIRLREKIALPANIIVIRSGPAAPALHSFEQILNSGETSFTFDQPYEEDEVIELLYTHGITGTLKGAMLTNRNLYSNAAIFAELCRITPQDRALLVSRAYHAPAQTCAMNAPFMAGATVVIHDIWTTPEAFLRTVEEERITFFFGTPPMYKMLLDYPGLEQFNTSSLRVAYTAAAPLPPEVFQAFEERFGIRITEGYGLTETSPLICSNPVDGTQKAGSVGRVIPGVKVKIVDYEDQEVPAGQVGEIVISGPNVMKGYYNREEETRWVMRNGWFHTEDLAYIDHEGYIYIVDRKKDLIIRGGLNVHPREVEDVLYTHPSVFEVAVLGMPDPVWGEEVVAFIHPREGSRVETKELQEYCKDKLAKYKIPRRIHFVNELPKTSSGKLLKCELKQIMENA